MLKFFCLVGVLLLLHISVDAQVDTEFWFAPPDASSGHGDVPVYVRISTLDQDANVRIIQPARGNIELANVMVGANTTYTINLTNQLFNLETYLPAQVMKTGIKIISTAPITAYYEIGATWNADIFALKGKNALGNEFVIPGQNFYSNSTDYSPTPYSSFDIVATQNNTVVKVRPTRPVFGHTQDTLIVVKLNAGETYSFRKATTFASDNPIGTIVEANKPVAITIKDDSVINGSCRDILGDQLVPVKVAGLEYVVLRGFLSTDEYFFVTAIEDDTELYINGVATPVATLSAGGLYRRQVTSQATYIVASRPVYVFHVTGFGCELGMAILPSINCKGSQQIGFSRTTSEFFGLNVLVRKEGVTHFTLNGSSALIPSSAFAPVPGSNDEWYAAQLSFSTAQIPVGMASLISNTDYSFQVGIINGNAQTTCRYGYFSAFSTLFIGDDVSICDGDILTIDAGPGKESYQWSTGASTQSIDISAPGEYWVEIEKEECILRDTLQVQVVTGHVDLGPDVEFCEGTTATVDGKENFSWLWSNGSTSQFLETTEPGKYWVSVFDYTGCPASDTINLNYYVHVFDDDIRVKMNYVSVDTANEKSIALGWAVTPPENNAGNAVFLYKTSSGESDWQRIAELPADQVMYVDRTLNATDEEQYEYYVSLADFCRVESDRVSDADMTMLLTGEADTIQDIISLQWTPYHEWAGGVSRYEIWRVLDDQAGFVKVADVAGSEHQFSGKIASDGFDHRYVIRAVESSGPNESWSNHLEFVFDHPVVMPNVFTPNGDSYNEVLEIRKITLYKQSHLTILNRWGKIVYEAEGYQNDWTGEGFATGVYYYILNLRRNNKVLKGSLSILR